MKTATRVQFEDYLSKVAELNGISDATKKFAVDPTVQQTLETKIQESSQFLSSVNLVTVDELKGEKVGLGIGGPIASTTNTAAGDRATKDPTDTSASGYECTKTDFDTHITYQKLDQWAKFPDFQPRIRDVIVRRQGLDRIMIGFNGTSRAANSNLAVNALLQDVNIGWLQKYRLDAPARVLADGPSAAANTINVGAGGDYENLDALVYDAINNLIDPWHKQNTGLVAILGRNLLADKYLPLLNQTAPTEKLAADLVISQKRIGGVQAVAVPFFPDNAILVTFLENLSIYTQAGARRRTIVDNAKRDRIENYESANDAYIVEDYGAGCLVENIVLV